MCITWAAGFSFTSADQSWDCIISSNIVQCGTCSGLVRDLFETCLGPVCDLLGPAWDLLRPVWYLVGTCLGPAWDLFVTCLGSVWDLCGDLSLIYI